jgi:hypothetical protein
MDIMLVKKIVPPEGETWTPKKSVISVALNAVKQWREYA